MNDWQFIMYQTLKNLPVENRLKFDNEKQKFSTIIIHNKETSMSYSKLISASIVLYKPNMEQVKCVIESFSPSENRFLYLIDNSPKQTDVTSILAANSHIQYYLMGKNMGYGSAHNIAIKMAIQANAQYHVVLNPDLKFEPDIIDKIAEFMDADEIIAQVMPKILNQKGELQYLCKLIPNPIDLTLKRFLPQQFTRKSLIRYQLKFADYDKPMNIPYLSGCFMFLRTSALETVGGFDERFFMYPEDIDITRRMHKVFKTMYYPEVSIVHAHEAKSYKDKKMLIIHIFNIIKYFNKWGWIFDRERKMVNKKLLKELGYTKR
jgi:GT2 family glycosyltransferase